ncbi:hypothetical protein ACQKK2_14105 [Bacillus paranthracis]|uniref:hypothetical protein n=1 Tax=Bacillus paranthracis TaxID=2026186 RepID=UPI001124F4AA|nr:hypothetical protein [Bacillus cereus group sp. m1-2]
MKLSFLFLLKGVNRKFMIKKLREFLGVKKIYKYNVKEINTIIDEQSNYISQIIDTQNIILNKLDRLDKCLLDNDSEQVMESLEKRSNIINEIMGKVYVNLDDIEIKSDIDYSKVLQKVIDAVDIEKPIVFPRGQYIFKSTVKVRAGQKINFQNSTIFFRGKGVLFDCSFKEHSQAIIENVDIEMELGNEDQIAFKVDKFVTGPLRNINIYGGGYGIYSTNSHSYEVEKLSHRNPKKSGIYHQGDLGAELHFRDVQITFVEFFGGNGIEIERKTTEDIGGYYLHNVLIIANKLRNGYAQHGIYIHGLCGQIATTVFNLIGGGVDGFDIQDMEKKRFAIRLENVANNRFSSAWINSVLLKNTDNNFYINSNVPYGFLFDELVSNFVASNIRCGENVAFNFTNNADVRKFQYNNISTCEGRLANEHSFLTKSADKSMRTIFVDSREIEGALCIVDSSDIANKMYLRMSASGEMELIDQEFTKTLLTISQNGIIRIHRGALEINGSQVLGARKKEWEIPGGNRNNGQWDTETVSLQELASTMKKLIEDLHGHGLIGK